MGIKRNASNLQITDFCFVFLKVFKQTLMSFLGPTQVASDNNHNVPEMKVILDVALLYDVTDIVVVRKNFVYVDKFGYLFVDFWVTSPCKIQHEIIHTYFH